ncbi:hypothetical protein [Herbiconiux sp. L3-i23]|uniref:hypothetical protein n=1 Tax=Herbiconiux sp. L3-i23 TaxID=2905871 RepID=UPI00206A36E5|nr:hypothetical protein [Herbiconiux sp. L3-i23]BDI23946.1 hypothetical protein L3i23_27220 [Herbiconiux sp. L3-i23]
MTTSLPTDSIPATLAYVRLLIINLEKVNPRRSARLLLEFLDARTEHQALRLSDVELRAELARIAAAAQTLDPTVDAG